MSLIDHTTPSAAPPLVAGERLDRSTFHNRYERMPAGTRAELIGGVVYMPSPLGFDHGDVTTWVDIWLDRYVEFTEGIRTSVNASTFLDDLGEPQPDILLRILPEWGGQTRHVGHFLEGPPELIVEIARSSRPIDLGPKRVDYERSGVQEYVVVGLEPDEIIWHVRRDEQLVRIGPDADGLFRSVAFPGLWLDPKALFVGGRRRLREVVDQGVATRAHAAFVAKLATAKQRSLGNQGGSEP